MEFEDLLWRLLDDWRMVQAVKSFGIAVAKDRGPAIIMPERIIERVVNCAHYEKIKNLQDLRRETGWNCPDEIGTTIVAIVAAHGHPPAPAQAKVTAPIRASQATTATPPRASSILTTNSIVVNAQASPVSTGSTGAPPALSNALSVLPVVEVPVPSSATSCVVPVPPVRE